MMKDDNKTKTFAKKNYMLNGSGSTTLLKWQLKEKSN